MILTSKIIPLKAALLVENDTKKYLVVSDLHIGGFESRLAANNVFVGKNSIVKEIISEITQIINKEKPDSLILLGDVKSSIKSITKSEWSDVPLFFNEIKKKITDIILIPGNHDTSIQRLIPNDVTLISHSGLVLNNTLFTHGHTMPSENFSHIKKIILGHIHPIFFDQGSVLNGQRVWVSLTARKEYIFPSTKGKIEILVVPSFNKYLYATHKQKYKKSISPIIQRIKKFESAKVVTLDGSIIGDENILHQII